MPLSAAVLGTAPPPLTIDVDDRWLMAYAAGLGETAECYLDPRRPDGLVGHPVFPAGPEWALQTQFRAGEGFLAPGERRGIVHYLQDLVLDRPVAAWGPVDVTAQVVAVDRHRAGALLTMRLDGRAAGELLWTTWNTGLVRGADLVGDPASLDDPPAVPAAPAPGPALATATVTLGGGAAHVYTECARIWNPIHTDLVAATAAGLPGLILHGTATLAHGVSRALELAGVQDPARVRRVRGRFGAMVPLPSELTVRLLGQAGATVHFDVRDAADQAVVRDGLLVLGDPIA
jgi:acyl dehydratase